MAVPTLAERLVSRESMTGGRFSSRVRFASVSIFLGESMACGATLGCKVVGRFSKRRPSMISSLCVTMVVNSFAGVVVGSLVDCVLGGDFSFVSRLVFGC